MATLAEVEAVLAMTAPTLGDSAGLGRLALGGVGATAIGSRAVVSGRSSRRVGRAPLGGFSAAASAAASATAPAGVTRQIESRLGPGAYLP